MGPDQFSLWAEVTKNVERVYRIDGLKLRCPEAK